MPSTRAPWARPSQLGLAAISAVHWVMARTKTRSKNSSSGVTCSPWRSTALTRRPRPSAPVAMRGGYGTPASLPRLYVRAVDLLVVVGDAAPPTRLVARARRTVHVAPGEPLLTLIADLRSHIPRRIGVLGSGPEAAPVAQELHERGL